MASRSAGKRARNPCAAKAPQATATKPLTAAMAINRLAMVVKLVSVWFRNRGARRLRGEVSGSQSAANLVHGVLFQLTDTFGGYLVLGRQIVQRSLFLSQPAAGDDIAAALIQLAHRLVQIGGSCFLPVAFLDV